MRLSKVAGLSLASVFLSGALCFADMPAKEEFKEVIPVKEPVQQVVVPPCGWDARLSGGVPVYFFRDEDNKGTGGIYLDVFTCEMPINLRVGAEVRHMSLLQSQADGYIPPGSDHADITYVRIPFAAEYNLALVDDLSLYMGGGPDLVRTANDISDFTVGGHLDARLQYEIEKHFSIALEAGYMWSKVSDGAGDVNLDGAYIIPTIGYRF